MFYGIRNYSWCLSRERHARASWTASRVRVEVASVINVSAYMGGAPLTALDYLR